MSELTDALTRHGFGQTDSHPEIWEAQVPVGTLVALVESDGTITLSKAPLNPAKPPVFLRITRYDNCLLDVIDRWCR